MIPNPLATRQNTNSQFGMLMHRSPMQTVGGIPSMFGNHGMMQGIGRSSIRSNNSGYDNKSMGNESMDGESVDSAKI